MSDKEQAGQPAKDAAAKARAERASAEAQDQAQKDSVRDAVMPVSARAPRLTAEEQAAKRAENAEASQLAADEARKQGLTSQGIAAHQQAALEGLAQVAPAEIGFQHVAPLGQESVAVIYKLKEGAPHPGKWIQVDVMGDTVTLEVDVPTQVSAEVAGELQAIESDFYTIEQAEEPEAS